MTQYRAVVQRLGKFFPLVMLSLVGFGLGIYWAISIEDYRAQDTALMTIIGGFVVAVFWAFANAYRVHVWILEKDGLRVRERPRIPLTGLRRRALIPYADVRALQFSAHGAKRSLQVTAQNGRRFHIDQAVVKNPQSRFMMADPAADLCDLEQAIRVRAAQVGNMLSATSEGLHYFQTRGGLFVLGVLTVMTLPLSGLLVWALWHGLQPSTGTRASYEAALLLLLAPTLFGWLFVKSLKQRRRILNNHTDAAR